METEFIYWRHNTPVGIMIEEITGKEDFSGATWRQMAWQIWGETGKDGYREVGHYSDGAPYIEGCPMRISASHAGHMLVVATLPKTPEADLMEFSLRTAMGVDTERRGRLQVMAVRERYLSEKEQQIIDKENLEANIIAWTSKEALFKVARLETLDSYATQLEIISLPELHQFGSKTKPVLGKAIIHLTEEEHISMSLYSYESEGYIVTIAYSEKCAKFHS